MDCPTGEERWRWRGRRRRRREDEERKEEKTRTVWKHMVRRCTALHGGRTVETRNRPE